MSVRVRVPITPGTKNQRLLESSLYQGCCSSVTAALLVASPPLVRLRNSETCRWENVAATWPT